MTPGKLSEKVIVERSDWVRGMLVRIRALPLGSLEEFTSEPVTVDAAESCLRRALEALLDLGRHILAKGFGDAPAEYRQVAERLGAQGVLDAGEAEVFGRMAGYRNRLVHFYDRVSDQELYEICQGRLADVEAVLAALHRWVRTHPERIDREL
ncbi:MAG: DUF86 domain-containing protein [Longimicrobiales bacterium]|nr:DUF86 domain-containing protein [Longimicrobiales bacterium]